MLLKAFALLAATATPVFSAILNITSEDIRLGGGQIPTTIPVYGRHLPKDTIANLQLLNHLLNLKYAFLTEGVANITAAEPSFVSDPDYLGHWRVPITADDKEKSVQSALMRLAAQDKIGIASIQTILEAYGAASIEPCAYTFPSSTLSSFLKEGELITNMIIDFLLDFDANTRTKPDNVLGVFISAIIGTQARHDSTIRLLSNSYVSPTPFETNIPADFAYSLALKFYIVEGSCRANLPFTVLARLDHPVFGKPDPTKPPPTEVTFFYAEDPKIEAAPNLYLAWIGQLGKPIYTTWEKRGTMGGASPPPKVKEWNAKGTIYVILTDQNTEMDLKKLVRKTLAGPSQIILS